MRHFMTKHFNITLKWALSWNHSREKSSLFSVANLYAIKPSTHRLQYIKTGVGLLLALGCAQNLISSCWIGECAALLVERVRTHRSTPLDKETGCNLLDGSACPVCRCRIGLTVPCYKNTKVNKALGKGTNKKRN